MYRSYLKKYILCLFCTMQTTSIDIILLILISTLYTRSFKKCVADHKRSFINEILFIDSNYLEHLNFEIIKSQFQ